MAATRRANLLLALLLAAASGRAGEQAAPGPRFARLDNGLKLAILPRRAAPHTSVYLWIHCGPADAPAAAAAGERLARSHGDASGGAARVLATPEAVAIMRAAPNQDIRTAIDWAGRLLAAPDRAHAAPHASAARRLTLPAAPIADPHDRLDFDADLVAALWPNHAYGELCRDAAREAVELDTLGTGAWSAPANVTIAVVGDFDPEPTLGLARELLGAAPWRAPPPPGFVPTPAAGATATFRSTLGPPGIDFVWPAPRPADPDAAVFDVLMHALTNRVDGAIARAAAEHEADPPRWARLELVEAGAVRLAIDWPTPPTDAVIEATQRDVYAALRAAADAPLEPIALDRAAALHARNTRRVREDASAAAFSIAYAEITGADVTGLYASGARSDTSGPTPAADATEPAEPQPPGSGPPPPTVSTEPSEPRPPGRGPAPGSAPPPHVRADAVQSAARRLCESSVVVRLRRGDAPRSASGPAVSEHHQSATAPASMSHDVAPGVRLSHHVSGDPHMAAVTTWLSGEGVGFDAIAAALMTGSAAWTVEMHRDYLTSRGLDLVPVRERSGKDAAARVGLRSTGPDELIPQMIEIHARLLADPPIARTMPTDFAAAQRMLTRAIDAAARRGADELCVPRAAIGWRIDWPIPAGESSLSSGLRSLERVTDVEISIRSADPASAAVAARDAWVHGRPAPRSEAIRHDPRRSRKRSNRRSRKRSNRRLRKRSRKRSRERSSQRSKARPQGRALERGRVFDETRGLENEACARVVAEGPPAAKRPPSRSGLRSLARSPRIVAIGRGMAPRGGPRRSRKRSTD